MDFFSTVKRAIGVPVSNDDYEEYYEEEENDYDNNYQREHSERYEEKRKNISSAKGKVVPMPNELQEMKVVVLSPTTFDDGRTVCDHLKSWAPVIVKLDRVDREDAQRIIDFIMGACYTLDGHVQEIKEDVFLVAPSMVKIEKGIDDIKTVKSSSLFAKFL